MRPHAWWMDAIAVHADRHTMETVNRHLEKMSSERLPRGANAGFELKVHATLIALICTNMNEQSKYHDTMDSPVHLVGRKRLTICLRIPLLINLSTHNEEKGECGCPDYSSGSK
jgi:hypothetical protein